MLKHLGNGRIKDESGKVWFFHSIRKKVPNFLSTDELFLDKFYRKEENVLLVIGEEWVLDPLSDNIGRTRKRRFIEKEFLFKEIEVQSEPFFMIKCIEF